MICDTLHPSNGEPFARQLVAYRQFLQGDGIPRIVFTLQQPFPEIWKYAILPRNSASPDEDPKATILRNLSEDVETKSFEKIGMKVLWVDDVKTDVAPLLSEISMLPED